MDLKRFVLSKEIRKITPWSRNVKELPQGEGV